jgi:chaperonin GroES
LSCDAGAACLDSLKERLASGAGSFGSDVVPPVASTEEDVVKVRPLRDRILLRRIEEGDQRIGGIVIPDTAKEKPQEATVIAVGSGRLTEQGTTIPLEVKVGDQVLVGKYAGTEIILDGQEYLIVREDEVLGVAERVLEPAAA